MDSVAQPSSRRLSAAMAKLMLTPDFYSDPLPTTDHVKKSRSKARAVNRKDEMITFQYRVLVSDTPHAHDRRQKRAKSKDTYQTHQFRQIVFGEMTAHAAGTVAREVFGILATDITNADWSTISFDDGFMSFGAAMMAKNNTTLADSLHEKKYLPFEKYLVIVYDPVNEEMTGFTGWNLTHDLDAVRVKTVVPATKVTQAEYESSLWFRYHNRIGFEYA